MATCTSDKWNWITTGLIALVGFNFSVGTAAPHSLQVSHTFTVREGDSLSRIAQCLVGSPVYPKSTGSLDQILAENPSIVRNLRIREGDRVILPKSYLNYEPEIRFHCDNEFADERKKVALARQRVTQDIAPVAVATESRDPASEDREPVVVAEQQQTTQTHTRYSDFQLEARLFYLALKGVTASGSEGTLLSDSILGVAGSWRQHWSPQFTTTIRTGINRIHFIPDDTRTFRNAPVVTTHFQIALDYNNTIFNAGAFAGASQKLFYTTPSLTEVAIHSVRTPEIGLHLGAPLFDLDPFQANLRLSASYLLPTSANSFDVQSGRSYLGSIHLRDNNLEGGLFLQLTHQNTSLLEQTRTDLGFTIQYYFGNPPAAPAK